MQFIHPCRKRITNEIINIKKTMPSYQISELNELNDKNIYIQIITPNNNTLIFKLPYDYPFKPPYSLKCNNYDYRSMLKNMPKRIEYLYYRLYDMYFEEIVKYENLQKKNCLCCSTLLCAYNWTPACKIIHVLNEINDHNKMKRKIMYRLLLKNIFDNFNLPLELIRNVYCFL
jgi:hypothetical protein